MCVCVGVPQCCVQTPNGVAFSDKTIRMSQLTSIFCFIRWKCASMECVCHCAGHVSCRLSLSSSWFLESYRVARLLSSILRILSLTMVVQCRVCISPIFPASIDPEKKNRIWRCHACEKVNRHAKQREMNFTQSVVPMSRREYDIHNNINQIMAN